VVTLTASLLSTLQEEVDQVILGTPISRDDELSDVDNELFERHNSFELLCEIRYSTRSRVVNRVS
jgi:hypothetical protein